MAEAPSHSSHSVLEGSVTRGAVGGSAENVTCAPGDTHSFTQPLRWESFHPDCKKMFGEAHTGICPLSERTLTLSESCKASPLSTGSLGHISGPGGQRGLSPRPWSRHLAATSLRMFPTTSPARGCWGETLLRSEWSLSGASCDLPQSHLVP